MPHEKPFADVVVPLMQEVGEMLRPHFGNVSSLIENKSASAADIVTVLDKQAEQMYASRLLDAYPAIGFVGEEFGGSTAAERYWLVDPIDGTGHFVRGIPFCSTMIALIQENKAVFSAIYSFIQKDMYVAQRGQGATRNGESIKVSNRPLNQSYFFHEINFAKKDNVDVLIKIEVENFGLSMETINAGFEYAQIASGRVEGRIALDPFGKNYDYAPGTLLVEEAGGVVRNIGSDTYDLSNYNHIAANPKVYEELRALGIV